LTGGVGDKELTSVCIWARIRHCNNSTFIMHQVAQFKFILKFSAPNWLTSISNTFWVSSLKIEIEKYFSTNSRKEKIIKMLKHACEEKLQIVFFLRFRPDTFLAEVFWLILPRFFEQKILTISQKWQKKSVDSKQIIPGIFFTPKFLIFLHQKICFFTPIFEI